MSAYELGSLVASITEAGQEGDLVVQLGHGIDEDCWLDAAELRWFVTIVGPALLQELDPLPSPAQAAAQRAERRKAEQVVQEAFAAAERARTPEPQPPAAAPAPAAPPVADVPPAEQPREDVPQAAPTAPRGPAQAEPGAGVGYTILPGSDDEDAPPSAGGTQGGASGTLTLDGMDVGP